MSGWHFDASSGSLSTFNGGSLEGWSGLKRYSEAIPKLFSSLEKTHPYSTQSYHEITFLSRSVALLATPGAVKIAAGISPGISPGLSRNISRNIFGISLEYLFGQISGPICDTSSTKESASPVRFRGTELVPKKDIPKWPGLIPGDIPGVIPGDIPGTLFELFLNRSGALFELIFGAISSPEAFQCFGRNMGAASALAGISLEQIRNIFLRRIISER